MPVTTQQLLQVIQTSENKIKVAESLVELAERAENNHMLQQLLRRITPPPPFNSLEYIKPGNRKGCWAKKPYWREHPTEAQLEARLRFSEVNYFLYGTKGTVQRPDGTQTGLVNHLAGQLMRSKKTLNEKKLAERKKQKIIEKMHFLKNNRICVY